MFVDGSKHRVCKVRGGIKMEPQETPISRGEAEEEEPVKDAKKE